MKREVGVSIFAVLIVLAAILAVYYLGVGPTGFAVSNTVAGQNTVFSLDASSVLSGTLEPNGQYIFSTNNTGEWVNDTPVNFTADSSWANVTKPLNSTAGVAVGYAWYLTDNESNLANTEVFVLTTTEEPVAEPEPVPVVSVSQPAGEDYTSLTEIPLVFTVTQFGTNLTCLYNVNYAGGELKANTSVDCVNGSNTATFDLTDDGGDNVLTLYVSDTTGSVSASSPVFQITLPSGDTGGEGAETEEPTEEEPALESAPSTAQISLTALSLQDMVQGDSRALTLNVQNTGIIYATSCVLSGDDSGWVTSTGGANDVPGVASTDFGFSLNVPEETLAGAYTLSLSLTCAETSGTPSFVVNVLQKKLDFNITDVQRTRQNRVSVDYSLTELAGENQDVEIYFSIRDSSGAEVANASQNRSIDANETDDFRTNLAINESLNGTMTLSAAFNSQIYSSTLLEPIDLSTVTGGAIFGGVGGGSVVVLVIVVLVLGAIFFVARKMRKSKATQ